MLDVATAPIDPSNAEQARAWDGDEGTYWAEHAQRFDRSMAGYRGRFLDAAPIEACSRVLDIGCGTGQTTRDAAGRASSGRATGIDLSARMIELARALAERESVGNAMFARADAQIHPFTPGSYDLAISRTGAMFFGDPVAAFTNIARAVRPGGELVLLTWQAATHNEWFSDFFTTLTGRRELPISPPGTPGPFSLSDPDRVRALLAATGFTGTRLEAVGAPLHFGRDVDDAETFLLGLLGWMLHGLDETGRARALDAFRASLAAHHTRDGVLYGSAAWIVTAHRP
jgi:SAM-dependent methyltransferase